MPGHMASRRRVSPDTAPVSTRQTQPQGGNMFGARANRVRDDSIVQTAIDMAWWRAARAAESAGSSPQRHPPLGHPAERGVRGRLAEVGRRFLRVSLYRKILLANAMVVVAVTIAAVALGARLAEGPNGVLFATAIAALGVIGTIVLNAAILALALRPVRLLQETAQRVQQGDLDARCTVSPLADAEMERLVRTFNGMLDNTAIYRRRLREVAARAQSAAEEERKRVARELHDGTAQSLAAIRVRLRLARAMADADLRETQLNEISAEIGEAIEEVRRMAHGLRPPSLDILGLATAIDTYVRSIADAAGIEVELSTAAVAGLLAPDAELALYRVMQEALSNVVRHSGAAGVRIELERTNGSVKLSVEDDGSGFLIAEAIGPQGRGLGLFGMQERMAYVGGTIDIASRPGSGTRVTARVPITSIGEAERYA